MKFACVNQLSFKLCTESTYEGLLCIPKRLSNFPYCSRLSVVIVVDLSKPEEIWNTLEVFIRQVNVHLQWVYFVHVYMLVKPFDLGALNQVPPCQGI